jgi:Domain of unknown function (DUF4158)
MSAPVRSFQFARAAADRLGRAVQMCALRFLGFVPADLTAAPAEVVERLDKRVGLARPRHPSDARGRGQRPVPSGARRGGGRAGWVAHVRAGRVEGPEGPVRLATPLWGQQSLRLRDAIQLTSIEPPPARYFRSLLQFARGSEL